MMLPERTARISVERPDGAARDCSAWPPAAPATVPAGSSGASATRTIEVVAAENFWGSIAAQLGGTPRPGHRHHHKPGRRPARLRADGRGRPGHRDARTRAGQRDRLRHLGQQAGRRQPLEQPDRPDRRRRWSGCRTAATRTAGTTPTTYAEWSTRSSADYSRIDPADRGLLRPSRNGPSRPPPWRRTTASSSAIRTTYAGTPVGASECIFAMLAPALGLDLVTPPGFLTAISEGTDPTAADKADHRPADPAASDQGVRLQQPERDPGRPGADRRRPGRRASR